MVVWIFYGKYCHVSIAIEVKLLFVVGFIVRLLMICVLNLLQIILCSFVFRSNYFYLGLPQNGLKLIGDWAHYLYDIAVYMTSSPWQYHVIRYWHLYHTNDQSMKSDIIIRKFIKHYAIYSIGRATSLIPLLRVSAEVPVLTVYGTKVCSV